MLTFLLDAHQSYSYMYLHGTYTLTEKEEVIVVQKISDCDKSHRKRAQKPNSQSVHAEPSTNETNVSDQPMPNASTLDQKDRRLTIGTTHKPHKPWTLQKFCILIADSLFPYLA